MVTDVDFSPGRQHVHRRCWLAIVEMFLLFWPAQILPEAGRQCEWVGGWVVMGIFTYVAGTIRFPGIYRYHNRVHGRDTLRFLLLYLSQKTKTTRFFKACIRSIVVLLGQR